MSRCRICPSYAINPSHHGRDETDQDLCDVCYWRTRAPQWQPIESAPTKGSFLVFGGHWVSESRDSNDRKPSDVAHVNRNSGYRKFYVANSEEFWPYIDGPTHWQPLPAPPEVK